MYMLVAFDNNGLSECNRKFKNLKLTKYICVKLLIGHPDLIINVLNEEGYKPDSMYYRRGDKVIQDYY